MLPCNLALIACFAGVSVSQGSVAGYERCGGTNYNHFIDFIKESISERILKIG